VRIAFVFLVACSSAHLTEPAHPAKADPEGTEAIANATHSCADAALGLENATRGVREPDRSVFEPLRLRCLEDRWTGAVVDCFARMAEGDLGKCAHTMRDDQREPMFAVLAGNGGGRASIYVTRARLDRMQVGVPECDRFVHAVSAAMTCEALSVEDRLQLGNETAEFWSLPTSRLSGEDRSRMSEVCGTSLASLEQHALDAGCML
jgi:hypothetical protein